MIYDKAGFRPLGQFASDAADAGLVSYLVSEGVCTGASHKRLHGTQEHFFLPSKSLSNSTVCYLI